MQMHTGRYDRHGTMPAWYTQAEIAKLDALAVPVLLEQQGQENLGCTVKRPDENLDMYVFDPFNRIIREEYLECRERQTTFSDVISRSGNSWANVATPFGVGNITTGVQIATPAPKLGALDDTAFYRSTITFDNTQYKRRTERTVKCMRKVMRQWQRNCPDDATESKSAKNYYCCSHITSAEKYSECSLNAWWQGIKEERPDLRAHVEALVENCVESHFASRLHTCDCDEKNFGKFPLSAFYQGQIQDKIKGST